MSEHYPSERLDTEHLWSIYTHAQGQVEMWTDRAERALAQLVCRGEVEVQVGE